MCLRCNSRLHASQPLRTTIVVLSHGQGASASHRVVIKASIQAVDSLEVVKRERLICIEALSIS